jgi:hypothetical protein
MRTADSGAGSDHAIAWGILPLGVPVVRLVSILLVIVVCRLMVSGPAVQAQSVDRQIAAAVLPLPEAMRADASVLGYRDSKTLVELRKGSNGMICLADDPSLPPFHVACYHDSLEPFMARGRALRASGITGEQVDTVRFRELKEGKLKMPTGPAALWSLSGPPGSWDSTTNEVKGGRPLYVVYIPYATQASTGLPVIPGPGLPWIMFPGTPKAHIMFVPRMQ